MADERKLTLGIVDGAIDPSAFIAHNATVFGDVKIGYEVAVLFGAVIRADSEAIFVGNQSNVQDLVCLHADPGFPCIIGERVTIGHGAVVHGAHVEDDVLIGIRSIVMNGANIGRHSIIGAGALIPEGKTIPPNSLVLGVPGKIVRQTNSEDLAYIEHAWQNYVRAGRLYLSQRRDV
jgi:carbonic anhydrase/acetyltransferase-like protein (isoleucine patch superfamily)